MIDSNVTIAAAFVTALHGDTAGQTGRRQRASGDRDLV